jgi:hypothetical protein
MAWLLNSLQLQNLMNEADRNRQPKNAIGRRYYQHERASRLCPRPETVWEFWIKFRESSDEY